jgi:16S rRNA C967 or C1407 C5-methylase (RsmB/RsmF family)
MTRSATPLMRRCAASLFPDDAGEQERFLAALTEPTSPVSPPLRAVVWMVEPRDSEEDRFETLALRDLGLELPPGAEILRRGERVGGRAPFVAGDCYALDLSSVLGGSAMLATAEAGPSPRVVDACASPGGKSILAARWLAPSLLLANEFVLKRLGPLRHNLKRCRVAGAYTQSLAVDRLAEIAPGAFDLALVDAPCSGQSLLAKGTENPGCFHPSTVKGNARRQARILAAAADTVRSGGHLLYTTCTFSLRENEDLVRRFLESRADFATVAVAPLERHRSRHADFPCYRFYPHRDEGAGGFAALLRREGEKGEALPGLPAELLAYPVS